MKLSIKNTIYQSILRGKWLDISYLNSANQTTYYYIGIKDIDLKKGRIYCDIFNPFKSDEVIKDSTDVYIKISGIQSASIMEQSYYDPQNELIEKVNNDKEMADFLEIVHFDNNILEYLSNCYRLDNDPFLKEIVMIDGLDVQSLLKAEKYELDKNQFNEILEKVFKKSKYEAEIINRYQQLAINRFSIDLNEKQYVVAYRTLSLNFKDKTLKVSDQSFINKSFLISEDKKMTLGTYLDMDPDDFCDDFDQNERQYIDLIQENFQSGEKVNTRPTIFFLARQVFQGVDQALEAIHNMDVENKLTIPLKAFFGRNKSRSGTKKEVDLVIFDRDKTNIDQTRVVYNAMVNHVTYVKGPPGTGKTETIFNVILSAYANNKTVLVCSNNNHPVDDILTKMKQLPFDKNGASKEGDILFPMIRIGNNTEMIETIKKLREIVNYATSRAKSTIKEEATEASKNKSLANFQELKSALVQYEELIDLKERVEKFEKMKDFITIDRISSKLSEQTQIQKNKIEEIGEIKNEDVLKFVISASDDKSFQQYLYYSTLARFRKLLGETYKELRGIIERSDIEKAATDLNKYLRDDANLKRFLAVFPVVLCTNLSSEKLGSPKPQFDLCVMDEAGQCNLASSLIPIVRADDLLLVGDVNQLQPVTVLEQNVNDNLLKKNGIKDEYNYVKNSILSTMLRKDNNSKSILLRYHYRCGAKIANFVNKRFYENQLKLLNKNPGSLIYLDVKNTRNPEYRNSYKEEAYAIAKIIKENEYKDVGIITPFVNQASLINRYLTQLGIKDTKAGTIHTLQGSEKSVIVLSAALSSRTSKKTMDWIKNNHELINVGVTRAKEKFIFVGDKSAIEKLSKDENDIKVLSDYVFQNGELEIPKSEVTILTDFSNDSRNEKDFFETIKPYFNNRRTKFRIIRNIFAKEAIKNIHPEDLIILSEKEFDVVVQASEGIFNNQYRTIVIFEIDGGEHIGDKRTAERDRIKERACTNYGIKMIRIANSQVKDYELIIGLFELIIKDLPDIEQAIEQISLFE